MDRSYKRSLGLFCAGLLLLLARSEGQPPTRQVALKKPAPNAKSADTGGIHWLTSFDKARQQALRENKPVLLFQLFGKLDDSLC